MRGLDLKSRGVDLKLERALDCQGSNPCSEQK